MTHIVAILCEPERSAMALERLAGACPGVTVATATSVDEAIPHLGATEILITIGAFLGDQADMVYAAAPHLRWIQSIGTGIDNLADHPALSPGVVVTNVRGLHGTQMPELCDRRLCACLRNPTDALRTRTLRSRGQSAWSASRRCRIA